MTVVFEQLSKRVTEIKTGLGLDKKFDPLAVDTYQELTKAYILLIHAELEKYFELISGKIVYDSYMEYRNNRLAKAPLSSLLSTNIFSFTPAHDYDEASQRMARGELWGADDRINKVFSKYIDHIKSNNGIKQKNIFGLLWKLGLEKGEVGQDLLLLLDNFGTLRGSVAHTGYSLGKQLLNYEDEVKKVEQTIMIELEKFDNFIDSKGFLDSSTKLEAVTAMLYNAS